MKRDRLFLVLLGCGIGICVATFFMFVMYYDFFTNPEHFFVLHAEEYGLVRDMSSENEPMSSIVTVEVGLGMSVENIASMLYEKRLIKHIDDFLFIVKHKGLESRFVAGSYELKLDQSLLKLIAELTGS